MPLSPPPPASSFPPPRSHPNYAKGIAVNSVAWWHTGSLPGTTTEFVIRKDSSNPESQFTWSILTNVRDSSNLQDPLVGAGTCTHEHVWGSLWEVVWSQSNQFSP